MNGPWIASILLTASLFVTAAALFFRIPALLYVPSAVGGAVTLCLLVLKFADLLWTGVAAVPDVLLILMYLCQAALYGFSAWMVFRFGGLRKLWILPLLLYLAYYVCYQLHIYLLVGSGGSVLNLLLNAALNALAYGFLGYWLAYPYKKSYYRRKNAETE